VHFVVLHFLPAAHLIDWPIADVAAMYAIAVIITVAIASVTYTVIEKPMIRFGGALIAARRATASAQRTVQR
jgi:peptidoglycan/LPS O-acetylase OafA/YrhL